MTTKHQRAVAAVRQRIDAERKLMALADLEIAAAARHAAAEAAALQAAMVRQYAEAMAPPLPVKSWRELAERNGQRTRAAIEEQLRLMGVGT